MSGVALESWAYDGEHWGELRLLGGRQEAATPVPSTDFKGSKDSGAFFGIAVPVDF